MIYIYIYIYIYEHIYYIYLPFIYFDILVKSMTIIRIQFTLVNLMNSNVSLITFFSTEH